VAALLSRLGDKQEKLHGLAKRPQAESENLVIVLMPLIQLKH